MQPQCAQFTLTSVICAEHMFLLWEAGVWRAKVSCKGAACLCDWSLMKTLDTEAQVGFSGSQHSAQTSHIIAGKIKCVRTTLLIRHLHPCAWFLLALLGLSPGTLPSEPVPFADFILYPFAIINQNYKLNYHRTHRVTAFWVLWFLLANHWAKE